MDTIKINGQTHIVAELPTEIQSEIVLYEYIINQLVENQKKVAISEYARIQSSNKIQQLYDRHVAETIEKQKALEKTSDKEDAV